MHTIRHPMRVLLLAIVFFCSTPSGAKNLSGRFGFGPSYQSFTQASAVSLKFFHDQLLATGFLIGFKTDANDYVFGIRSLRNIVLEENMNLFFGVGASLLSEARGATIHTGVQFDALFGGEFFLSGLPNLGFQFEVGIGLRDLVTTSFHSVGGGFAGGSIHYYF